MGKTPTKKIDKLFIKIAGKRKTLLIYGYSRSSDLNPESGFESDVNISPTSPFVHGERFHGFAFCGGP
jgi:hypothetical protein